jgi:hypothetical protein
MMQMGLRPEDVEVSTTETPGQAPLRSDDRVRLSYPANDAG